MMKACRNKQLSGNKTTDMNKTARRSVYAARKKLLWRWVRHLEGEDEPKPRHWVFLL